MKTKILTFALVASLLHSNAVLSQGKRPAASAGRPEYIEVEKNVKLHLVDLGEGQSIVLIHGWPLNNAMYEYQYQYLVERGFRVIGISLRGFGKSDKPYGRYDFDVFSDDIKAVLEKLKIENAVLGGFSMGGAVALHYTIKYDGAHLSKLALFAAAAPSWLQRPGYPYGLTPEGAASFVELTKTDRPQVLDGFDKAFAATEGGISKGMSEWLRAINLEASPYATTQSIQSLANLDLRSGLTKVEIPVAIFHGVQDKLCDFAFAEQLHEGIQNSYLVKFEKSGHALFIEEMEKFNLELEKFAKQEAPANS
ncbi:alpha/beta hydrolase [Algoriphagus sp. H41]|uniref:Alpha/beta hydrolase n=1 Tax=Algoriphagus oliviformis TaxID=2811231 RepID=A0ABS3C413_9BACT|nr:alpha/beta hydrolase [Algoriphagus oliviformis]MBN7811843.1 alpha/beta hydrolase [Algoriphagus oliviformis]